MGRPDEKRGLRRTRRRWEHDIKMNFKEEGCEVGTGRSLFRIRRMVGLCKGGNEPRDSLRAN